MRKLELIKAIRQKTGVRDKDVHQVFDALVEILQTTQKVVIPKLGVFRHTQIGKQKIRNPQTGEMMDIPPRKRFNFKPSLYIKNIINNTK